MNDTIKSLRSHRSIRRYHSRPVPPDLLQEILDAGTRGSTYGLMMTYSIIKTTDPALKQRLYLLHREQDMILQAPLVLTFCADVRRMRRWAKLRDAKNSFDDLTGFLVGAIDAVIAAQNCAVAAESAGLGICYMGTTLWGATGIAACLELPENVIPVTSMVMGYPDEQPAVRARLPLNCVVHEEKYQDPSDEALLEFHREREANGVERYRAMPEVWAKIEELGIRSLAEFYTSEAKYPKSLHVETSRDYLELLRSQGFWNF